MGVRGTPAGVTGILLNGHERALQASFPLRRHPEGSIPKLLKEQRSGTLLRKQNATHSDQEMTEARTGRGGGCPRDRPGTV